MKQPELFPEFPEKELIAYVDKAIDQALRHDSGIDADILKLRGFSTGVQRRLIHNLCRDFPSQNPVYLEVGLYAGATFCAALNNNPNLIAIGLEDFSQPFDEDDAWIDLDRNLASYGDQAKEVTFIDRNAFGVPASAIRHKVDIFYYDGEHSEESQAQALPHFLPTLAPYFLFLVDDHDWKEVESGTRRGLDACNREIRILKEWKLSDGKPDGETWHNGVAIFLCQNL